MNKLHLLLLTATLTCGLPLIAADAAPADDTHDARPASLNTINAIMKSIKDLPDDESIKIIDKKIDINSKNKDGESFLHEAVFSLKKNLVTFLLDKGADVNAISVTHFTPLHYIGFHIKPDIHQSKTSKNIKIEILQILLDYGADPTIQDNKDRTIPFYDHDLNPKIKKLLLAAQRIDAYEESDEDTALLPNRRERTPRKLFLPSAII